MVNYTSDTRVALRHPLILDGLSDSASHLAVLGFVKTMCLHVLFSFQRTDLPALPISFLVVWGTLQSY